MEARHDPRIGRVMTIHHVVLAIHVSVPISFSLVENVVSLIRTLIVAAIVHVPILLMILAHHLIFEVTTASIL